jgi:hypothetical protein
VVRGDVLLEFVSTEFNVSDMFTKALPAPRLEELRSAIGVSELLEV